VKRLIINADDFGLTAGVNRSIIELYRASALTSTTLMAEAAATSEALSLASSSTALGVGCHVVLVDGKPVLPARQLPTLVDPATGRFRTSLGKFVKDLFSGHIRPEEIEAEAGAQIARLKALGLQLTHIDTHKHTHMFPRVLRPLLKAARTNSIRAIRNPFEPAWSVSATADAPLLRRLQVQILRRFQPAFRATVERAGLATTDGAIGVLATGTLNTSSLASLLRAIPEGTWELVTHPGENDESLANAGTRLLVSREVEHAALRATTFPPDVQRIHFGELATP
jgi:hopanoid biosynthesis associated protein HpnK